MTGIIHAAQRVACVRTEFTLIPFKMLGAGCREENARSRKLTFLIVTAFGASTRASARAYSREWIFSSVSHIVCHTS
jgi:hypothetical protein